MKSYVTLEIEHDEPIDGIALKELIFEVVNDGLDGIIKDDQSLADDELEDIPNYILMRHDLAYDVKISNCEYAPAETNETHREVLSALRAVLHDYDDTGCEGCGTIMQETLHEVGTTLNKLQGVTCRD